MKKFLTLRISEELTQQKISQYEASFVCSQVQKTLDIFNSTNNSLCQGQLSSK